MKIAIILCLFTGSCFAQTKHPETDFYLENNKMYWEHTYEVLSKSTDDLIKYFQKEVLINIKQDNFQIIDNTISFEVNDDKVNFKKYGGTAMGTAFIAQLFMKYLVVIDFKDNKYRVTVKDIFLDNKELQYRMSGDISEFCTKKATTVFLTGKTITTGMIYNHKHFLEKFDIKTNESLKKDW
jgi:hypothetical protein